MRKLNAQAKINREFYVERLITPEFNWLYLHQGQPIINLHMSMFTMSLLNLANEEQLKIWKPLA